MRGYISVVVLLMGGLPMIAWSIDLLRAARRIAEINVVWYTFSLVFVIFWCLNLAAAWGFIELPRETHAGLVDLEPWTRPYFYMKAKDYLTDIKAELALIAAVIIIAILPQLMTYVVSGLSGCASTPRFVLQFEKIAIWSLIKFLAALGGFVTADALDASYFLGKPFKDSTLSRTELLALGWGHLALAFGIAFLQIVFLIYVQRIKTISWLNGLHRWFTRNVPRSEEQPSREEKVRNELVAEIVEALGRGRARERQAELRPRQLRPTRRR
jgi:hypothetical protein